MKSLNEYWINIFFLALAILIINLWVTHHFGEQWYTYTVSNGILLLIGIISSFLKLFSDEELDQFNTQLRRIFATFLKPVYLSTVYIVILIVGSTCSSVTILSGEMPEKRSIKLVKEQNSLDTNQSIYSDELNGTNEMIQFRLFSSLFGKPYYLEVEGYNRYSFDLYSWVGAKVRIDKDLDPEPSVIFRVPTAVHALLTTGKIEILLADTAIRFMTKQDGAFLLSQLPSNSLIENMMESWKLELESEGIKDGMAARTLTKWRRPKFVRPGISLKRGSEITVRFLSASDKLKAQSIYSLTSDRIQDVLLQIESNTNDI